MDTRPNILFIMADDHGANAISSYGSRLKTVFETPHLDRIANDGVRLSNCHCTNSICTPSRATILTGQHSHTNGVRTLADKLDPAQNTCVKMLQSNGYATAIIGKWHLKTEPQGFDYYHILPGQGRYFDPQFIEIGADWSQRGSGDNPQWGTVHEGYVTDLITDFTLDWLKQRDTSKPFFLMCHHKAPHDHFEYHPRHEHLFDDIDIPEPDSLWEDRSHRSEGSRQYGTSISERNAKRNAVQLMSQPDYPTGPLDLTGLDTTERTKAAYQKYLRDYLRTVKAIDEGVGRLLDYLDEAGLSDNTIVIYTSDQGMFLGEHDYMDKRWIFDEALQMPFLMRFPKEIPAGTLCNDIISNVDFAPTFLDYAGLLPTDDMEGRSFRANVEGNTPTDWSQRVYYRYWMHSTHHDVPAHYGLRTRDYKLIFFYGLPLDAAGALPDPTPPGWELFDLKNDPHELHNVYDDPSYADVAKQLKAELFELKQALGDVDSVYPELMARRQQT